MKLFFKKLNNQEGSALLIVMLIFFTIFIVAFASGYSVFLNIFKSSDVSDNMRAYYAAKAGVERSYYEAIKNNYNFYDNCVNNIFGETLDNNASYEINCVDDGVFSFYSVGKYKKSQVALKIDCININDECQANCLQGSLCGGGKLLYHNSFKFVVSPSGCNATADSCDNDFLVDDSIDLAWEEPNSAIFSGASSTSDGLENIAVLDPQTNTQFEAAKYCDDLVINGFDDWYLPAVDEIEAIGQTPAFYYFNISEDDKYWSSTESLVTSTLAFLLNGADSEIVENDKDVFYKIRCIRKF
ncbi:MAG TPA: DUF1566 domain-containing protein [bacterium]|nr:DUF1566 domain-containing protein [bacterium]